MNNRDRILTLLSGGTPDRVPWAGDLDYWYSAARTRGDLPAQYQGDGYFQLNRDLGSGFYLQGYGPYHTHHTRVTCSETRSGNQLARTLHTPHGDLTEIQQYLPTSFSWGYVKHFVETPADLPAFQSYLEDLVFSPAYEEAIRRRELIGDNGVVLCYTPRSPFMECVTTYIGIVNLVYLLADAPCEMGATLALMERQHDIAAQITLDSPAECIMIPENLSSEVVGAGYYQKYLLGYETRWIERIRMAGKFSFIHMDGTLSGLLRRVSGAGFDVIEAVTPLPCGDLTMEQAAAAAGDRTILWGGLPGLIFTPSFPEEDFAPYVMETLALMRQRPRFVLGVADQVPPDGLLERVARVAELCDQYGTYR